MKKLFDKHPILGPIAVATPIACFLLAITGCQESPSYEDVQRCSRVVGTLSYEKTSFDGMAYLWDGTKRLKWNTYHWLGLADERAIRIDRVSDYIKYSIGDEYCDTISVQKDAAPATPSPTQSPAETCDIVISSESFKEEVIDPVALAFAGSWLTGIDVRFVIGTEQHGKRIVTDEAFVTHPIGSRFCFSAAQVKQNSSKTMKVA